MEKRPETLRERLAKGVGVAEFTASYWLDQALDAHNVHDSEKVNRCLEYAHARLDDAEAFRRFLSKSVTTTPDMDS